MGASRAHMPSLRLRDVTACNNATGTVVQTHYPGTWFLNQYASPGVSLSTKDRCSEEVSHGATVAFPQALSRQGRQARQACFWKKSRPAFKVDQHSGPHCAAQQTTATA